MSQVACKLFMVAACLTLSGQSKIPPGFAITGKWLTISGKLQHVCVKICNVRLGKQFELGWDSACLPGSVHTVDRML